MHSVGMHDEGVHYVGMLNVGMHSVGRHSVCVHHKGMQDMSVAAVGVTKQHFSSAVQMNIIKSAINENAHFFLLYLVELFHAD